MKSIKLGGVALLVLFAAVCRGQDVPLIITGKISSSNIQTVSAPRTDRWNIQIQWMIEEGTIVKPGDTIAVFDSGSVDAQLEQNEDALQTQQLELKSKQVELDQAVSKARSAVEVADLEVEKARIEAEIESDDVSDYDKGQYKLALERALVEQFKAQQALEQKLTERENTIEKQKIEITKLEENIEYQRYQLSQLKVVSTIEGVVSHMYHPWNNEKITAGTSLQAAMKVMEVQDIKGFKIDAWVHEIDADRVKAGNTAVVTLDAFPGVQHSAQVTNVVSQPEKKASWGNSAYYQMELSFTEKPTQKLLPGMSVRVVVPQSEELAYAN
ncbi:HlyD family secretion protein [Alteromonas gilva]|uniref:HlyD family efflux transporter periplasmic adaptor subunit n=1 Tax=Alteromonas gilva TaxID=2987522 RepID=A0ABT5L5A4_9ALTE|nr:HlyD family efflux transporter periplasmic adaptor subunit [Alteromonas gilva]MDC8831546.1 HlyD family efflux transporter periplasmic adaptor subunit [Alteromonas gilva]